ncbi:hypothetical protein A2U01_0059819, partial [Trifolium medium]|nr:hypothetical protein [Trifolium medium]
AEIARSPELNGELTSAASVVAIADEDTSWHMLSGELAYVGYNTLNYLRAI